MIKQHAWKNAQQKEPLDENERFQHRKCALYLLRVLDRHHRLDQEAMELMAVLLGKDLREVSGWLLDQLKDEDRLRLELDLEDIDDQEDLPRLLMRALHRQPRYMLGKVETYLAKQLRQKVREWSCRRKCQLEKTFNRAGRMFGLSPTELELAFFLFLNETWPPSESYFDNHLHCDMLAGRKYLLAALDLNHSELGMALNGRLRSLGFLEDVSPCISVDLDLLPLFSDAGEGIGYNRLFQRVTGPALPLSTFMVSAAETSHLLALLKRKTDSATNVLLYGAPGTGKSSFVKSLVKKLGVPAYEIVRGVDLSGKAQRGGITACLNMTNGGQGSIIIVDEADGLLNTMRSSFFQLESQDKSWLNQVLEAPGTRMIWITNQVAGMEESVRRRFAYSLVFKPFSRAQRVQIWRKVLHRHRAAAALSPPEIVSLAGEYKVSAGVVDTAVRKARETAGGDPEGFRRGIRLALDAHLTLLGDGQPPVDKDALPEDYCLEALNLDVDVHAVLEQAKAFNQHLRAGGRRPLNFNLLLHGESGTGKSGFARYLAHCLDRPVLAKRASDLLGPYVGQSERNVAEAFREAEREEAVMVIDEADSLLGSRQHAHHSWEVTLVNEVLAGMEQYRGIMACTTNRLYDLDPACLRRFAWKINFGCLTAAGRVILYNMLLAPLLGQRVRAEEMEMLKGMHGLTPGDFALVNNRLGLGCAQELTHKMLVAALLEEVKRKQRILGIRTAGFLVAGVGG